MAIRVRSLFAWTAGIAAVAVCGAFAYGWATSTNACDGPAPPAPAHPMRAITYCTYGSTSGLRISTFETPAPKDSEVLVRVHAAAVNAMDWHYVRGTPYFMRLGSGLKVPSVTRLGADFAGTVEAVGKSVTEFKPGDEVFGTRTGSFGEYVTVRSGGAIAHKPANVSFEAAAATGVAAVTALQGLRDHGHLAKGERVLINGATGGVGTYAVQLAKAFGAHVTGVNSAANAPLVRALGADTTIDYKTQDYTQSNERYDLIVDVVGNRTLAENRRILTPKGRYVQVGGGGPNDGIWFGPLPRLAYMSVASWFVSQQVGMMLAQSNKADLTTLADLMAKGMITSSIDRTFPFEQTAAAVQYVEDGKARAKVVVTIP